MAWNTFPYPDPSYKYSAASLRKAWPRLHAGDAEPWPSEAAVVKAWIAFHAGDFESAARQGLAAGTPGYAPANKAICIYAAYLEESKSDKHRRLLEVAQRCERQQQQEPGNAAAWYWHAYALGRYSQDISVVKALAEGIGSTVKDSLEAALELAPRHADAHTALGVYHAEVISKIGSLIGGLTYGASADKAIRHFKAALALNPASAIARLEYANGLIMLDERDNTAKALALRREAAAMTPHDAMERLDLELARQTLEQ
jgi:tetratricopeptide (TPR) repeat protein